MTTRRIAYGALVLEGVLALLVGWGLIGSAGRQQDPTLSGVTGLLGLLFAAPGILAVVAGIGAWRGRRWAQRAASLAAVVGVVVAVLTIPANPPVALLVAALNMGLIFALRSPAPQT